MEEERGGGDNSTFSAAMKEAHISLLIKSMTALYDSFIITSSDTVELKLEKSNLHDMAVLNL